MNGLVVVARQASSRLPLKHLYPIDQTRSALEVMLGRLAGSEVDKFILATGSSDVIYQDMAKVLNWDIFASGYVRDDNVLERIWRASLGLDKIVIVHGDSPLVNASLVNRALAQFKDVDLLACSGPSGFRIRVISGNALQTWYRWVNAQASHPLAGLLEPPGLAVDQFHLGPCEERFTIDEYYDVQFVRKLVSVLGADQEPGAYIEFVNNHPDLRKDLLRADAEVGGFSRSA